MIVVELILILGILMSGEIISKASGLPIPGNVIGLLILLGLLWHKILKVDQIKKTSDFLLEYLAFLFLPAAVGLMGVFDLIASQWWKILLVVMVTTALVMVVTGITVQYFIRRQTRWKQ